MKKTMLVLILSLFLISCTNKDIVSENVASDEAILDHEKPDEENIEIEYSLEYISIPDANGALTDYLGDVGENYIFYEGIGAGELYRLVQVFPEDNYEVVDYYVEKLSAPYTEWSVAPLEMKQAGFEQKISVYSTYVDDMGVMHFAIECDGKDYIGRWNEQDGFSTRELHTERSFDEIFQATNYGTSWYDEDDELIFCSEAMKIRINAEGQIKNIVLPGQGDLIFEIIKNRFTDRIYFAGVNEQSVHKIDGGTAVEVGGFTIWDGETGTADFLAENIYDQCYIIGKSGSMAFASEKDGFVCNQTGICHISMEDGSIQNVVNFEAEGLTSGSGYTIDRMNASIGAEGDLFLYWHHINDTQKFAKLVVNESHDKPELELAVTYADNFLKSAIVDFNKQNPEYKVVLRTLEDNSIDDYKNTIMAEISAGSGPDILESSVLPTKAGAKQGFLYRFTEGDLSIIDGNFSSTKQLGKVEVDYYGIPYSFDVTTVVADKRVVGEKTYWTLDNAMNLLNNRNMNKFMDGAEKAYLFYYLAVRNEDLKLVDWENKKSNLNDEKAVEILEFVSRYSKDNNENLVMLDELTKNECLTEILYLFTPSVINYISQQLQRNEIFIGFPTEAGIGEHYMQGTVLGVNSKSENIEGAKQFIEFLLSEEQQKKLASMMLEDGNVNVCYPVKETVLKQLFEDFRKKAKEEQENDDRYSGWKLTEEEYNVLWEVLQSAKVPENDSEVILDIIAEESNEFFLGVRTAMDVLDIIDNRVQLYLDEE